MPVPPTPPDIHATRLVEAGQRIATGDLDGARKLVAAVLAVVPDHPGALFQSAYLEVAANRPAPAAALLERCLALQPDWTEARIRLGQLRLLQGEVDAALSDFRIATTQAPMDLRAAEGLAEAHRRLGRDFAGLVRARARLVELEPARVEHHLRLGYTLRSGDLYAEAAAAYAGALAVDPGNLVARWSLFQNPPALPMADAAAERAFAARWSEGLAWFEALDPRRVAPRALEHALLTATDFALHYQPGPLRDERCRHADLLSRLAHAAIPAPAPRARRPGSRRRVALVSAFFRRHSVTKALGAVLAALDAERFEVGVFHLEPHADAETERWRRFAARHEGGPRTPAAWLQALADFGPDAVVFPDLGMDPLSQVLAAFRSAPVQVALWGHPITSGHATIDHFVSADLMEVDDPRPHYRETVHRLPHLGTCYAPPPLAPRPARADGEVHFLLAQSLWKISPLHDALLARIAEGLPQARFHLLPSPRAHLREALAARIRRAFDARGVDFERHVRVLEPLPEAQFHRFAAGMDVNLDSIGWSGGISTLDLLAQGLPTVTVDTPTLRGRQSAGILRRAGVEETIARDAEGYVATAIALGRDRERREHLRGRLLAARARVYDDPAPPAAFAALLLDLVPAP
jgi:predicted O-linked N-acetylglucosamine transferase (SPINDLY family)